MNEISLKVKGMTCASCVTRVEKIANKIEGIENVSVNLATEKINFSAVEQQKNVNQLSQILNDDGYELVVEESEKNAPNKESNVGKHSNEYKADFITALIFTLPVFTISMLYHFEFFQNMWSFSLDTTNKILLILTTPVIFVPGKRFFSNTVKNIKHFSADMNTLVAVGSGAAYVFSTINTLFPQLLSNTHVSHDIYFETAAVIITLILMGKFLETRAKAKTSEALKKLINLTPTKCTVVKNNKHRTIETKSLQIGDTVLIKPGESIPADGIVTNGHSSINESMITGESIPIDKNIGSSIIGGTINLTGSFEFVVKKIGTDSFLGSIVKLIENTQISKPPIQKLADKISGVFVQVVIVIALLTGITWYFFGAPYELNTAIINTVAVLIVACPCALGLATPTAILVGSGLGANNGILIKDAESLETLYKSDYIVFDKTGTITEELPIVKDVISFELPKDELIKVAASVEAKSEHPYAKAIVEYSKKNNLKITSEVNNFKYLVGSGITATINNQKIKIGSKDLFKNNNNLNDYEKEENIETNIYIAIDEKVEGYFTISDKIKDDAAISIKSLHSYGIKTYLLTGDNKRKAVKISEKVGIQDFSAEVKPDEKVKIVKNLQNNNSIIAMVGDGINDAAALTQANVGIAMGTGTDIAIESAQIILLRNKILDVNKAYILSKKTMGTLKQNLFWAFIYNVIGIPLAALGLLNPMIAALAMSFSSVSVVSNSLRLRNAKLDR